MTKLSQFFLSANIVNAYYIYLQAFKKIMKISHWEMKVTDVFHLTSRHTILVGRVQGIRELIGKCMVEIILDDKVIKIITIDGEWMTGNNHPEGHRAISTTEPLNLTHDLVLQHDCRLRIVC